MKSSLIIPLIIVSNALYTTNASSSIEPIPGGRRQINVPDTEKELPDAIQTSKPSRIRQKWLSKRHFGFVKSEKFSGAASKAITYCQYGIIAYLAVGILKDLVSMIKELNDEFSSNRQHALSRSEVKDLMSWLEKKQEVISTPSPSISLPWMASIALNLFEQTCMPRSRIEHFLGHLTVDQAKMLHECLLTSDRKTSMESVGGLAAIKQSISDWISFNFVAGRGVITPYDSFIKSGRQGLALWGPPGCGKSLLIKAIANKSRLPTLVVTPSLMQNKYYGESTKRVRSLFSLVSLLGPCIVVLDELDGLFKSRNAEEIEVSRDLKTEWLQWWDGVASDHVNNPRVLFVGATNRPWDCDPAVWRRLPQRYYVGVPSYEDRMNLFQVWANTYKLPPIENDVLALFARHTEGYIPSDLYHIMQSACRKGPVARRDEKLTMADIHLALAEIPPTRFTLEYVQQIQGFLSPHAQAQQQQQQHQNFHASAESNGGSYFETPMGNYYQFQVPVEPNETSSNQNQNDVNWDSDDFDTDEFLTDSDDEL